MSHKMFVHAGTLIRGVHQKKSGESSQFDERALIQNAKKANIVVVRGKKRGQPRTLTFMQPK